MHDHLMSLRKEKKGERIICAIVAAALPVFTAAALAVILVQAHRIGGKLNLTSHCYNIPAGLRTSSYLCEIVERLFPSTFSSQNKSTSPMRTYDDPPNAHNSSH
jgi:hypothetical protein